MKQTFSPYFYVLENYELFAPGFIGIFHICSIYYIYIDFYFFGKCFITDQIYCDVFESLLDSFRNRTPKTLLIDKFPLNFLMIKTQKIWDSMHVLHDHLYFIIRNYSISSFHFYDFSFKNSFCLSLQEEKCLRFSL